MDARIKKTLAKVYRAFGECLQEKDYASLTVEDILRRCNVARSTFYAHFRTKDDVLDSFLSNTFHHIFSHSLTQETSHDFSKENAEDFGHLFTHLLYHLRDERELVTVILASSCRQRFLDELRKAASPLILRCIETHFFPDNGVPKKLRVDMTAESFLGLVCHWFSYRCAKEPEEMVGYFLQSAMA